MGTKRSKKLQVIDGPENGPKPKPIRDPCGYKEGLYTAAVPLIDECCCLDNNPQTDKEKLREAFERFGIDLSKPVFARMMKNLEGLTPMECFMMEGVGNQW
jgi:hypothetical protein